MLIEVHHAHHSNRPDRVMQNQLMVSVTPIIAYARVPVDYQGFEAKLLEPSSDSETTLPSTSRERNN